MDIKDKIVKIIDKELYEKLLEDLNNKYIKTYLYHFIIVKYKDNNDTFTVKIDNIKDLKGIEDKEILVKYYLEKIHYFNEFDNDLYAEGSPLHIYNIGYFLFDGDVKTDKQTKEVLDQLFDEYENNYNNLSQQFNDLTFLSLNK